MFRANGSQTSNGLDSVCSSRYVVMLRKVRISLSRMACWRRSEGYAPPRHPGRLSGPPELPPGALGSCRQRFFPGLHVPAETFLFPYAGFVGLKVCTELPDSFFRMKSYAGAGWGLIQGAASPANRWKTVRKLPEATGRWDASLPEAWRVSKSQATGRRRDKRGPGDGQCRGVVNRLGWLELGHAWVGESCCAARLFWYTATGLHLLPAGFFTPPGVNCHLAETAIHPSFFHSFWPLFYLFFGRLDFWRLPFRLGLSALR